MTTKPDPDDIDCVLWDVQMPPPPSPADYSKIQALFHKATVRALFNVDCYFERPPPVQLIHREAYWKGFFGYCHDGVTAKGFAEVQI